jgi:hypothetical protein
MNVLIAGLLFTAVQTPPADPTKMLQGTWKLVSPQRRGENVPPPSRWTPLAIDLTSEKNPDKAVPGIFEVKGDTLKLCWAKSGGPRPTEFSTKKGADEVLFVLRREKK